MLAKRRLTTRMRQKDYMGLACVAPSANAETSGPLRRNPGIVGIRRQVTYYVRQLSSSPDDDLEKGSPLPSTSKSRSTRPTRLKIRECERRFITPRLTRWVSKLVTA